MTELAPQQLAAALDAIQESISTADSSFDRWSQTDDEWSEGSAVWYAEIAFRQLLLVCEVMGLPLLRAEISTALERRTAAGLSKAETSPDGDPYMACLADVRRFHLVLQSTLVMEPSRSVTKDLETIVRGCTYAVTDKDAFGGPPSNESELHYRIEAVLRCVFPDLLRKPRLSKPIKNFEPDTGIPSLKTLIEYKFIASANMVPQVADEILADTRGYSSKDWNSFLYVLYETERFRAESAWRQLLRECGVAPNSGVVVLSGERPRTGSESSGGTRSRRAKA